MHTKKRRRLGYQVQPLGRPAVFLLPSLKLKRLMRPRGPSIEDALHEFLLKEFGGYTASGGNIFGFWLGPRGRVHYGEHKTYTVAFLGKDRIPRLIAFLAKIARVMGEECVYLETGEDASLIYPERA